ncbi:MAG: asparagine synthase (glutamine-hydrolyzing) [Bacteroidales bacterium]|nr:asparagine synthase (glutamine-hydrolyzing) [Bacteroidales bacterium]
MCGVAGIIDYRGKSDSVPAVKEMLSSFSYRGPDESGIYHSHVATIGNVRLSIIDLATGQQPLSDFSGRYWIVFNGEIFNYIELRKDLEKKGLTLKTQSDTEVLVNLFSLYGENCLSMLNGQFAVAIWDKKEEKLFIARDRVGIRPLFYTVSNGAFYFASEIKALFCNKELKRELNPENLAQIYTFWTAITPATAFSDISELSPGHYLTFGREGLIVRKFWELSFNNNNSGLTLSDALERFNELFTNAVRIRLRADVEVAAYLSGGIDSSTTVAYIKDIEPGVLNTFSIGFEDKDFDESKYQLEAVKYLNTTHRAISCTSKDIAEAFPRVVWHSETPLTRTAPTPMLILSKLVRDNDIKVVITGEGSDEILAGYDIFREAIIRRFWASQPSSSLRPTLLKRIYPDIPHLRNASPNILKMFFGYRLEDTANPLYSHLLRWNNSNHIKKHFSDAIRESVNSYDPLSDLAGNLPDSFMEWSPLARAQWLETTVFMSGYLLSSQGDRMAMANSVEGRYPFLDYRVIEYCSSLPDKLKLNGLNEKYLLKKLMTGRIPGSIVKRPKQPYRAPISSVFMGNERPDYVDEMLSEKMTRLAGIFSPGSVAALLAKVEKTGAASEMDNMTLAAVISTHLVHRQFIDNNNAEFRNGPLRNLRIIEENKYKIT